MKRVTIVAVDDHILMQELWTKMFSVNNKIEVTGGNGKSDEAIEMIKIKGRISVCLILT